jgi:predicted transport protein
MIYKVNADGMKLIKQVDFDLERHLQRRIESNLSVLFDLRFLATEYPLNKFRFDTVAFDDENNSFVIIEYKKGVNESLVDQGYAYLNTVFDRKSDLVLLYNRVTNSNKQVEDFDWESVRLYFVSPKFTDYQKTATGYQGMPFRLFEVNQYENDLFVINEINNSKIKDIPVVISDDNSINKVSKEIKVYVEEDHLKGLSKKLENLYYELRNKINDLGDLEIKPTKTYIAFKYANKNVCDIEVFKSYLKVFINVSKGQLIDTNNRAINISTKGHHGNGDYAFDIKEEKDIEYLLTLIKQSYKINS